MDRPQRIPAPERALVVSQRRRHWSALAAELEAIGVEVAFETELEKALDNEENAELGAFLLDFAHPALAEHSLATLVARLESRGGAALIGLSRAGAASEQRSDDALDLRDLFAAGGCEFLAAGEDAELSAQRVRAALRRPRTVELRPHGTPSATQLSHEELLAAVGVAMARAERASASLAVLCFDFDPLRDVAGSLPASQAEHWFVALGERLRDACRSDDTLARVSGDGASSSVRRTSHGEFVLLLVGSLDEADLVRVARRLSEWLREPLEVAGEQIAAAFHVGAAMWRRPQSAEEVYEHARTAAYWARQRGVGSVEVYSDALKTRALERLSLESALRRAVEREEFVLHYQPRVSVESGRTLALEALVRWRHAELGLISPADFIPLAESTGLIVPLGSWVLRQACMQAKRWQEQGFEPVRVAVNLSPVQFRDAGLYTDVQRALRRAGLDPRWLELELTESSLMESADDVIATLRRFKALGISISIDDFGTGYSSLAYLRRFPIDALKIDRSFLREVTRDPDDASIATAIVLLAKCLRLRVVAEGVETPGQLAFLRIMKCDEAQGFHFSRPLPAEDVVRFLEPLARGASLSGAA
jgi:EAL domain-containing protein (putative c-di-GMP-specific phosphodiesterase class I)/GGDEF domain-containing protein